MCPFNRLTVGPSLRRKYENVLGDLRPGERIVDFAHCRVPETGTPGRVTVILTDQRLMVRRLSNWEKRDEPPLMSIDGADIAQVSQIGEDRPGRFALTVTDGAGATEVSFLPASDSSVSSELAQNLYENLEICVMHWRQGQIPFL